ncbi:MAG: twin-arginine translocase subunit TatC [Alphaproteobacteria bacterium]|nr:twin-arginine translocase subunit TatC [Rickettsiales bacterium]
MKTNKRREGNFVYHLTELRKRVILCLYFTIISVFISYYKLDSIMLFITKPLLSSGVYNIIATSVTETFFTYLSLAITTAVGVSVPFYILQLYLFLQPALLKTEQKNIIAAFLGFIAMFIFGCCLLYYCILPNALKFLGQYKNSIPVTVHMQISLQNYVGIVANFFLGFGLAMQLPLLIILLTKGGLVTVQQLRNFRKFAIIIIFITAGAITPPDIPSQLIVAAILVLLYELTIVISKKAPPNINLMPTITDEII